MISIIAAVGKNNEIGKDGGLVFHIPEDMRYFKEVTMGHKIVMGRKTWESLPHKLPGRESIVVSRGEVEGADKVIHDLERFLEENAETEEEIFVIGGGQVYEKALDYAKKLYLTEVDRGIEGADTYFPEFNNLKYNREVIREGRTDGLGYSFVCYTKK